MKGNWKNTIPLGIAIISIIVFGVHRSAEPIGGDEPFTLYFSQWNLQDMIPMLFKYNNIPPTYEIILHYWISAFGLSEDAVRLLPALFSALTVPAIYLIGKRSSGIWTGVLAASLFMLSPFQMEWAHLVRSYSMMIFGTTWSMYFFLSYTENRQFKSLVGWIIFSFIATSAHYLSWLLIITQGISFFSSRELLVKKTIQRVLLATAILILLNTPYLYFLVKRFIETASEGTYIQPPQSFAVFFLELFKMISSKSNFTLLAIFSINLSFVLFLFSKIKNKIQASLLSLTICVLIGVVPVFFLYGKNELFTFLNTSSFSFIYCFLLVVILVISMSKWQIRIELKTITLWLVFPLLFMYFASSQTPMFIDRYLSFISPAIPLLIAISILSLPKPAALSLITLTAIFLIPSFQFQTERFNNPKKLIDSFKKFKTESNYALWSPGYADVIFTYHFDKSIFQNAPLHQTDTVGKKIVLDSGYTVHKEGLRRELSRNKIFIANDSSQFQINFDTIPNLIFLDAYSEYIYPQNGLKAKIEKHYGPPQIIEDLGGFNFIYTYQK